MKKLIIFFVVSAVISVFLVRSCIPVQDVAKVQYIKTQADGDGYHTPLLYMWVKIVEINNRPEFESIAVSQDGEIAKLPYLGKLEAGKIYRIYLEAGKLHLLQESDMWIFQLKRGLFVLVFMIISAILIVFSMSFAESFKHSN